VANILYQAGVAKLLAASTTWVAGTWKVLLERSTSTYAPAKADATLLNAAGLVEISVATYARQTISTPTVAIDNTNSNVAIKCDNVDWGNLETGQTVKSIIAYLDDGSNGVPLFRIDTDEDGLLPRALGGGDFSVTWNAAGVLVFSQA
jgi:hypothetical protein